MPNIKSAKKRVLINAKKTQNNLSTKSSLKTTIKKTLQAIENNDASAEESVNNAYKKIDQAVSKNTIHKNTAARKKSRLAKKLNAAKVAN